ncbi:hypothetical protein HAX54_053062 [Datura stramonium]|uniref:Uncharacterized protein n=1 Tax=Datura stramonium TaxID=4076 RepID=A0ABS8WT01_DATST|nr:hypothetical protein [Datura stramonium]
MGHVRVCVLGYMKQASRLASTNYDEGEQFGLLAIDEARRCLCVRRVDAGTGPSQRLVNRHAAALGCFRAKSLMCWCPSGLAWPCKWHQKQRTASNAGRLGLVFGMRCQSICT